LLHYWQNTYKLKKKVTIGLILLIILFFLINIGYKTKKQISKVDKECINALLTLEHLSLMCQVLPPSNDAPCNQQQTGLQGNQQAGSNANNNCNNSVSLNKTSRRATYPEISENALIDNRIRSMQFEFDALGILPKCQQAELLFSMFADGQIR
jgi:hypothetical protein